MLPHRGDRRRAIGHSAEGIHGVGEAWDDIVSRAAGGGCRYARTLRRTEPAGLATILHILASGHASTCRWSVRHNCQQLLRCGCLTAKSCAGAHEEVLVVRRIAEYHDAVRSAEWKRCDVREVLLHSFAFEQRRGRVRIGGHGEEGCWAGFVDHVVGRPVDQACRAGGCGDVGCCASVGVCLAGGVEACATDADLAICDLALRDVLLACGDRSGCAEGDGPLPQLLGRTMESLWP